MTDLGELLSDVVKSGIAEERSDTSRPDRWHLSPATVVVAGESTVIAQFDGEGFAGDVATTIVMTSLVGYLAAGARVMVLIVPPSGNYIVSRVANTTGTDWIDYTPTIVGTTGPNLGAGSIVGRWRPNGGRNIDVEVQVNWGAGSTQGTGSYEISAPFTATARATTGATGACLLIESGVIRAGIVVFANTTNYLMVPDGTGIVGAGNPGTWSNGDLMRFKISHEIEAFS